MHQDRLGFAYGVVEYDSKPREVVECVKCLCGIRQSTTPPSEVPGLAVLRFTFAFAGIVPSSFKASSSRVKAFGGRHLSGLRMNQTTESLRARLYDSLHPEDRMSHVRRRRRFEILALTMRLRGKEEENSNSGSSCKLLILEGLNGRGDWI